VRPANNTNACLLLRDLCCFNSVSLRLFAQRCLSTRRCTSGCCR
jgi:hypothetical protein